MPSKLKVWEIARAALPANGLVRDGAPQGPEHGAWPRDLREGGGSWIDVEAYIHPDSGEFFPPGRFSLGGPIPLVVDKL